MNNYRKKPVVIEAIQWTGDTHSVVSFMGGCAEFDNYSVYIQTLEGEMKASLGDYIIKGVKGEFYPCKPDVFEQTYEPVTGDKDNGTT